jgi:hypothetical protein
MPLTIFCCARVVCWAPVRMRTALAVEDSKSAAQAVDQTTLA